MTLICDRPPTDTLQAWLKSTRTYPVDVDLIWRAAGFISRYRAAQCIRRYFGSDYIHSHPPKAPNSEQGYFISVPGLLKLCLLSQTRIGRDYHSVIMRMIEESRKKDGYLVLRRAAGGLYQISQYAAPDPKVVARVWCADLERSLDDVRATLAHYEIVEGLFELPHQIVQSFTATVIRVNRQINSEVVNG